MDRDLMQETTALYALAPQEFTKARNERAKELRAKDAELAAKVAKLPKPTAAAAAINRVARDDPSEVRALVQAGRALRSAQESALAEKSAGAVADATREHRAALDRVRREARRLELSDAVLERVTSTLRAASVDPELQPLLERGLIAQELEPAGFGLDPGLAAAAPPRKRKNEGERVESPARAARLEAARERLAEAKRVVGEAERERKRLARELESAERELEQARAAVEKAEGKVDDLRGRA
ncbi:MAG TPA: hypothetical protein VNP93_03160 [Gaiellaceae bacterium]|nr:hypothetical protein [Gaiellaceae bacterium]